MKPIAMLCAALALMTAQLPAQAAAQTLDDQYQQAEKPLMVIRFNQRNVYYDRPLYNVASRAMQAKPDVVFSIIALGPDSASAAQRGQEVAASLARMGVPQRQIALSARQDAQAATPEVRVYLR